MSRISSDLSAGTPPDATTFRRAFVAVVVVLAVLCAVFVTLGFVQGPRFEGGQVDTDRVVAAPAQQLRLFANQPLAEVGAEQVTVEPAAAFTVSVAGDAIAVQFTDPLDYATDYSVTVDGVTNTFDDQSARFEYAFRTGSPNVYYLDRGTEGAPDTIVRTGLAGTEREIVFSASEIQDFVPLGTLLVVATLTEDASGQPISALGLVSIADGTTEVLNLPQEGTVDKLRASNSGSLFGFTFTTAGDPIDGEYSDTLMWVDVAAGRTIAPVPALDGNPMSVFNWMFVPNSTSVVALTTDESALMVDTAVAGSALPLGQFSTLTGISADGSTLSVSDRYGAIALDLATLEQTRLPPSLYDGAVPYGGEALALPDHSRVQTIAVIDQEVGTFSSVLVLDDGEQSRKLFQTVNDQGQIDSFSISPNNQFVAVEVVPSVGDSVRDGYAVNERSTSVTTVIINLDTGAVVRSLEGFALAW